MEIIAFLCGAIALALLLGCPVFGIGLGVVVKERFGFDGYWTAVFYCLALSLVFGTIWGVYEYNKDEELYDIKLKAYCIDGTTKILEKDSISAKERPYVYAEFVRATFVIVPVHSPRTQANGFALRFGGNVYHGVYDFDIIYCRKYIVTADVYRKLCERREAERIKQMEY